MEYCGRKDISDIKSTETFPGVMAIVEMPEMSFKDIENSENVVLLDGVKDPGNLGTIIRTADWFGVSSIILGKDSVDPYNEKTVRSTMGSIFRTNIFRSENSAKTIEKLKSVGFKVNALTMNGKNISELKTKGKNLYIFGSESHGIDKKIESLADSSYTIPGNGRAESLNLGVSVGIVLSKI